MFVKIVRWRWRGFQATQLTHMTALTGQQSIGESGNFYFEQLIKASLNIRPSGKLNAQTLDFFNQLADISLGLKPWKAALPNLLILPQNPDFQNFHRPSFQCPMPWHFFS